MVTRFALLTTTELRLVDLLLASGGIPETPAAVRRDLFDEGEEGEDHEDGSGERPPDLTRRRPLRGRVGAVDATARDVGGSQQYGSVTELILIRRQPLTAEERNQDRSP